MDTGAAIMSTLNSVWCDLQTAFMSPSGGGPAVAGADGGDAGMRYLAFESEDDDDDDDTHRDYPFHDCDVSYHLPDSTDSPICRGNGQGDGGGGGAPSGGLPGDLLSQFASQLSAASGESALTSAAVSIGSALLGSALGAAAAVTISPFAAVGIGAGMLVAGLFASVAMPDEGADGSSNGSADEPWFEESMTESLLPVRSDTEDEETESRVGRAGNGTAALTKPAAVAAGEPRALGRAAVYWQMAAAVGAVKAAEEPSPLPPLPPVSVGPLPKRTTRSKEGDSPYNAWCEWSVP